jgi:type III secretion protein Q
MHQPLASVRRKTRRKSPKHAATSLAAGEPLVLEQVAPERVEALNTFYRRRLPVEIVIAGEAMTFVPIWPIPGKTKSPHSTVAFTMGDKEGELHVPRGLVERWLVQADPDVELARLAPEHAALLLESLLSAELVWLEARLGCRIAVTTIENRNRVSSAAHFAFSLKGKEEDIVCTLHPADFDRAAQLSRLLDRGETKMSALPLDLPVPVRLWRSAVAVGVGDLQSLRPGDVVLLDDIESEAAPALIVIGGRLLAPVEFTNEGVRLTARPRPATGSKWEWIMDRATDPVQSLEDADLEDLPMTLVFELGRTALPLGEVRQLAPGAIVRLPEVTRETVDVIANGKRVGCGEIVRIGESLGVRVVRMFDNA